MDCVTQQPVANARVYWTGKPEYVVVTSTDGNFDFPAVHQWKAFYLIPAPDINHEFIHRPFVIEASGYKTNGMFLPSGGYHGEGLTKQIIYLNPLNRN